MMNAVNTAVFIFHGDLGFFLAPALRGKEVRLEFESHQTVKHLIESLGVPHVEVGSIRADETLVGNGYQPRSGDRIEVQPTVPGCPVAPLFILDSHLGRLAAHLRMLGFDCLYRNDYSDSELADPLTVEARILLSRDRRLLMRKVVQYGYCPRSLEPEEQLREVVRRFGLAGRARPFTRCMRCNGLLVPVAKSAVLGRLEPLTKKYFDEFATCADCDQIYWKGSHWQRLQQLVEEVSPTGSAAH